MAAPAGSTVVSEPPCEDEQKVTLLSESKEQSSDSWNWPRKAAGAAAIVAAGLVVLALAARPAAGNFSVSQREVVVLADDVTFDCKAGYSNWQRGWSGYKKDWCCKHGDKPTCSSDGGDSQPAPFDCEAGASNWDAGWAVPKKIWCCQNGKHGCGEPNVLKVSWVHANVNYDKLKKDGDLMKAFKDTCRSTLTQHLSDFNILDKDVRCVTWAGSALHSTGKDANTGVVVRANVTLPKASDHSAATAQLNDPSFKTLALHNAEGVVLSICNGLTPTTHDVTVEPPIVSSCTCENGEPADGAACGAAAGEKCKQCDGGYHLSDCSKCEENACICAGGMPATGTACPVHGEKKCLQCRPGFHYDLTTQDCLQNVCRCYLGFPATGPACSQANAHICGSCYDGYDVDDENKQCVEKDCVCTDGSPASPEECPSTGAEKCESCNDGFHVDAAGLCKMNTCTCPSGRPAVGPNCPTHAKEWCASCKDDFFLHEGQCSGDKECDCKHGTPVSGDLCTTNHATICKRCDAGYTLSHGQCVTLRCVCDNGVPADDDDTCTTQGGEVCLSCSDGYHLEKDWGKDTGKCKPKQCECNHGRGAVGKECAANGEQSCAECDAGYRQKLKTVEDKDSGITRLAVSCKANACTCEDKDGKQAGIPAVGEHQQECHEDGSNVCVRCDSNYRMVKKECVANSCVCPGGTPVGVEHCRKEGDENCASCKSGYWLARNDTWEEEVQPGGQSLKPHYKTSWDAGRAVCLPDSTTTVRPFDCLAGAAQWELGWSPLKKHWCCINEQVGCVPKLTATEMCEGKGFTMEQCANVGCCKYTSHECTAKPGWEDDVCKPSFRLSSEATGPAIQAGAIGFKCIRAIAKATDGKTILDKCDNTDNMQAWRPSEYKDVAGTKWQIKDGGDQCLHVKNLAVNELVIFKTCANNPQGVAADKLKQNFRYGSAPVAPRSSWRAGYSPTGKELWIDNPTVATSAADPQWCIQATEKANCGTGYTHPCMKLQRCDASPSQVQMWSIGVLKQP